MRLRHFVLIMLAGYSMALLAQTPKSLQGTLSVNVTDAVENARTSNVITIVHPQGAPPIKQILKFEGAKFETSLKPGLYDVFVAAPGFKPACTVISVKDGETATYSPRLRVDDEHMQQSSLR